jgi:hypothetical protein
MTPTHPPVNFIGKRCMGKMKSRTDDAILEKWSKGWSAKRQIPYIMVLNKVPA